MEEMLLRIKSEKSASTIKSLLEELDLDVEMIATSTEKAWMSGEPFTKDEMEKRHQIAIGQIAAGNTYSYDEVKDSVKELFRKHGHDLHP